MCDYYRFMSKAVVYDFIDTVLVVVCFHYLPKYKLVNIIY